MQSDSEKWKQKRIRSLDLTMIVIFAVSIPAAIFYFSHVKTEWAEYVDSKYWTMRNAQVAKTSIERDWDSKNRELLVIQMDVDGLRVTDAFTELRMRDARLMQEAIKKRGTVVVYRNDRQRDEYTLSPALKGSQRYGFTMVFGLGATLLFLGSIPIFWHYLRRRYEDAAGTRHRFHMDSVGETLKEVS